MPYIGNTIRAADDYRLIDDISSGFNGSTTQFALQVAGSAPVPFPKSPQQVLISVNGVIQEPDPTGASGFNLVGTNIVFSSAPTNGHAFFGIIYATADYLNSGGNFPSGSLGAPSITFVGDEDTGIYRKGSGSIGFVADSTEIANTDSNGLTISSGNLILPDSIIHGGDSNTKIRFPANDQFTVETGGAERFKITDAIAIFNDGGADVDFKVEGDTDTSLLYVEAGNDRVGIGTSVPTGKLSIASGAFQTTTPTPTGDDIVISGNQSLGIQFLTLASGTSNNNIFFGDTDDPDIGRLHYAHATNSLHFQTDAVEHLKIASDGRLTATYEPSSNGDSGILINTDDATRAASLLFQANSENRAKIGVTRLAGDGAELKIQVSQMNNSNTLLDAVTFAPNSSGDTTPNATFNGNLFANADSTHDIGSNTVRWANGYFDTLYGDGSNLTGISSDLVNDTSPQLGGLLDTNGSNIKFADSSGATINRAIFGTGDDLQIYHDGTNSIVTAGGAGDLQLISTFDDVEIKAADNVFIRPKAGEDGIKVLADGAVELYHNNTKMLSTESRGAILQKADGCTLIIGSTNAGGANIFLDGDSNGDGNGGDYCGIRGTSDGHLVLFADNPSTNAIIYFQTGNSLDRWFINADGHFIPNNNNAYDIGSTTLRVRNIYSNDLHLSNKGSQNDVDSTWGDYTIQEGFEDLFLINHRTGKKFKFNLTEVS